MGSRMYEVLVVWGDDCVPVWAPFSCGWCILVRTAHLTCRREPVVAQEFHPTLSPSIIARVLSFGRPQAVERPKVFASVIAVLCSNPAYRLTGEFLTRCVRDEHGATPKDKDAWVALVESEPVANSLAHAVDPLLGMGEPSLFSLADTSVGGTLGELPSVTRVEVDATGLSTAQRVAGVVEALPTRVPGPRADEVIVFCIDGTPTSAGLLIRRNTAYPVLVDSSGRVTKELAMPDKSQGASVYLPRKLIETPQAGAPLADVIMVALASRE